MSAQAIDAIGRKGMVSVIGGSRFKGGTGRDGVDPSVGLQGGVEARHLTGLAPGFGGTRGGIALGDDGGGLGPIGAASGEVERVPAKAETTQNQSDDGQHGDPGHKPAQRRQGAQEGGRAHGNTRRSISKCGPSRKVGQSPPQTMAVPCSAAAAFTASAMRG